MWGSWDTYRLSTSMPNNGFAVIIYPVCRLPSCLSWSLRKWGSSSCRMLDDFRVMKSALIDKLLIQGIGSSKNYRKRSSLTWQCDVISSKCFTIEIDGSLELMIASMFSVSANEFEKIKECNTMIKFAKMTLKLERSHVMFHEYLGGKNMRADSIT